MLVYHPSPLLAPLWGIGFRLHLVKNPYPNPYAPNLEAQHAFTKLGNEAAGAVPKLIQMYDAYPDPSSQTSILLVLGCIGPEAKEAMPVVLRAMTNASESVRLNVTTALGSIKADPAQTVPVLITRLSDSNCWVQLRAIVALGELGKEARPAVPALLQLLRHEKYDPAKAPAPSSKFMGTGLASIFGGFSGISAHLLPSMTLSIPFVSMGSPADLAASALWMIDPDAANSAHLKRPE